MIEPSLDLYGEAYDAVDRSLEELLDETKVRYGMLVDRKGFVISHKEALWAPRPPAFDSVATLVAGNAAATSALANMLGETVFGEQVLQGEKGTLFVQSVGKDALLTLVFDSSVPLQRVRMYSKRTISKMLVHLDAVAAMPKVVLNQNFTDGANALVDDAFAGLGLNDL